MAEGASSNTYEAGQRDDRPWGSWQTIDVGPGHVVKRIVVNPGGRLSLQYHHGRSEHWVIVEGEADVTLGAQTLRKQAGEGVHIPLQEVHRVANPGQTPLVLIEVQTGALLDEADIVRMEDEYGRS